QVGADSRTVVAEVGVDATSRDCSNDACASGYFSYAGVVGNIEVPRCIESETVGAGRPAPVAGPPSPLNDWFPPIPANVVMIPVDAVTFRTTPFWLSDM